MGDAILDYVVGLPLTNRVEYVTPSVGYSTLLYFVDALTGAAVALGWLPAAAKTGLYAMIEPKLCAASFSQTFGDRSTRRQGRPEIRVVSASQQGEYATRLKGRAHSRLKSTCTSTSK